MPFGADSPLFNGRPEESLGQSRSSSQRGSLPLAGRSTGQKDEPKTTRIAVILSSRSSSQIRPASAEMRNHQPDDVASLVTTDKITSATNGNTPLLKDVKRSSILNYFGPASHGPANHGPSSRPAASTKQHMGPPKKNPLTPGSASRVAIPPQRTFQAEAKSIDSVGAPRPASSVVEVVVPSKRKPPCSTEASALAGSYLSESSSYSSTSAAQPKKPATSTTRSAEPVKRAKRPRGRPPLRLSKAIHEKRRATYRSHRDIYDQLQPEYLSFRCEWEGCPADLQNLDTLRKHLLIVHGREETCRWGKCAAKMPPEDFPTWDQFEGHMRKAHLVPISWHLGDGPKNTSVLTKYVAAGAAVDDSLPNYLFDGDGNQVTPSISHQQFETDDERKQRKRRLQRLILQRDRNAREPEEDPVAYSAEDRAEIFSRC